eukprot:GHUV01056660.1.p1 GENE.GHUV01056660.1~~GHUV01056660.1.p1  ORF type:complete len:117 (-),score=34.02 GHUV01056660.1:161-511(-)
MSRQLALPSSYWHLYSCSVLEDAICWGCHFQEELLFVSWPQTLLDQCSECSVQLDPVTGLPIWRGLRVKVGMSYGMVNSKKPLNTGRADYYGVLANGAARVMALAAPGQVRTLTTS